MNTNDDMILLEDIKPDDKYCNKTQLRKCQTKYETMKECKRRCPIGCTDYQINYFYSSKEIDFDIIDIKLAHSRDKFDLFIQHLPKWSFQDLWANIGGLAGLWLGWSLVFIAEKIYLRLIKLKMK